MSKFAVFMKSISWSNWKLSYTHPEDFYLQRWQTTTQIDGHYLVFRLLFLQSITLQIHLLSRFTARSAAHLPYIYFTHWTFLSMGVYALLHLLVVTIGYTYQQVGCLEINANDGSRSNEQAYHCLDLKWFLQLTLALTNISHNCAVCVTLCFWSAFWTQDVTDLTWATKMYHVWLSIIIIWNYVLVSIPFRIEHTYLPFGFGLAYSLFSVAFYYVGGTDHRGRRYIYKLVNWEDRPGIATCIVIGALFVVFLVQILLFWLDWVKMRVYRKWFVGGEYEGEEYLRSGV